MFKRFYIALIFLVSYLAQAQYGNEWINYDQTYYKFPITETGVYRITYNDLNNAGFPVSSIDPRNIQIFGHQDEVTLHIQGENDASFDSGDFIEFYAEKPDGRFDDEIFIEPSDHVNKFYNFFSDTIYYFITWNTSTNNKRYSISNSSNYTSFSAKPYVFTKKRVAPVTNYRHGTWLIYSGGNNISDPRYVTGEGYFQGFISKGQTHNVNINISNPYIAAGVPNAKVYSASSAQGQYEGSGNVRNNHVRISHTTSSGTDRTVYNQTYSGVRTNVLNFSITNADLLSGNMTFKYSLIDDTGSEQDYYSFAELEFNYPHTTNFEGLNYYEINYQPEETDNSIRIDATNISGTNVRILDTKGGLDYISPQTVGSTHHFVLPHSPGQETNYVIFSNEAVKSISSIRSVSSNGRFTNYLDNSNSNNFILITHKDLLTEATNYKNYRQSAAGGEYSVTLADVEQLYDQFGAGVMYSSLSIRRFLKATLDTWTEEPKGVFVLGKGVHIGQHVKNSQWGLRKDQVARDRTLIPVLGEPATDNMFTIGLKGDWTKQDIPIGRYAATSNQEVDWYLEKIKVYEQAQIPSNLSVDNNLWQKEVLHLIAGANAEEQERFLRYTRWGGDLIQAENYGALLEEQLKDGDVAIDPTTFQELIDKIKSGVSIIQYFGHSNYSNGFDTNLDKASNWENINKYPIVIANGCNSGDLYRQSDIRSTSEDFVILPNEGAISYISTTATGFDIPLAKLTEEIYREISTTTYGESIGRNFSNALSIELTNYESLVSGAREAYTGSIASTTIHGDPMLKPNGFEKPEYIIQNDGIVFTPSQPTLEDELLEVTINVYNIGKATSDTVKVELVRTFPNGVDSVYIKDTTLISPITQVKFNMPINHAIAGGLNNFVATVDIPNFYEEIEDEEINNRATKSLVVFSDGVIPIIPHKFAIHPNSQSDLIISTFNPDEPLADYIVEIDTTDLFNSPWLKTQTISAPGGSILVRNAEWKLSSSGSQSPITFQDSTVYFWRATKKDKDSWRESSFQYIKDKTGWEQAHFFQFKEDDFKNVNYDRADRKFKYDNSIAKISAEMYSNASSGEELAGTKYSIFSEVQDYGAGGQYTQPAIGIGVIDPNTLETWGTPKWMDYDNDGVDDELLNPTHFFGQFNEYGQPWRNRPDLAFWYQQNDNTQLQNIQTLVDAVPDGHYILFYVYKKAAYSMWDDALTNTGFDLYALFQNLGATSIVPGQPDNMIAVLAKKGDPSVTVEYYSAPVGTERKLHEFTAEFTVNSVGFIDAPLAGPTSRWNAIYWQQNPLEVASADSSRLQVFGNNGLGTEQLLIDTLMSTNDSIKDLYNIVDAKTYPFLRLKATLMDDVTNTPAQINRWQILYDPVPEASIEPSLGLHYTANDEEVQEGENVEFAVAFKNISEVDMDSIMIKYWLEDRNHREHVLKYERIEPLPVGKVLMDTITFNTLGFGGENTIWLEINTISNETGRPDQVEQYHFNNFYAKRLSVIEDDENPIVDVTFDGARIFDGDIVSPSPNIIIKLKDENQVLKLNQDSDTSLFRISMVYPDQIFDEQIYFKNGRGETVMQWYPATGKDNEFTIEYNPENLPDGIYTLKVQGADKSNNLSGDLAYDVQFEVVNESSITHFYNYPNPFSTRTRFVFTLTGSKIPDEIYIQIMTVTGKIVKQITQEELGHIRIGKNVTEYYWNGTDDFGDVLANGVYLYRVVTKINGEEIKHRETSGDNLFKHNYGKLYILR